MINYGSLLQNVPDIITKWDSYFITDCDRSLLQNASDLLNGTTVQFITTVQPLSLFSKEMTGSKKKQPLSKVWSEETPLPMYK